MRNWISLNSLAVLWQDLIENQLMIIPLRFGARNANKCVCVDVDRQGSQQIDHCTNRTDGSIINVIRSYIGSSSAVETFRAEQYACALEMP